MLYESTLVSDEAPFDKFVGSAGLPPNFTALSAQQINGMSLFIGKGKCVNCHKGPDFTGAGVRSHAEFQEGGIVERMTMAANGPALYDNGFYNMGSTTSASRPRTRTWVSAQRIPLASRCPSAGSSSRRLPGRTCRIPSRSIPVHSNQIPASR